MFKYNILYKTINILNGNIYIGVHSTDDINDGYLGSGKVIISAIKKYGRDSFKREVINRFNTREQALLAEREYVNSDFIKQKHVYNLKEGGNGNSSADAKALWNDDVYRDKVIGSSLSKVWNDKEFQKRRIIACNTPEAKEKHQRAVKAAANRPEKKEITSYHSKERWKDEEYRENMSNKTSAYMLGTIFIHNDILKKNTRIKKYELASFIKEGWKLGLKLEYRKQ
jgi:hypothetical protein